MADAGGLIPVRKYRKLPGTFTFGPSAVLQTSHPIADGVALKQLRAALAGLGVRARLGKPDAADVRIIRDKRIGGPEAYELAIRPGGIRIRSARTPGAYYAVQTLRDLLAACGKSLPATRISDSPDFPRRGVYLDCSRGKVPKVKTVKQLVERLAHWKVNELQLYIENTFRYARHPAIGVGYSPFTAEDILAIQDHCKAHHVRLVGSLASFGHMDKILSLPAYRHLAESLDFSQDTVGDLCPTDPASIKFLAELYDEFLPLLEAEDFNACCDETRQIGKGRSRRRAERIGVGRVYLEFILKIRKLCHKHGKRMNIWGDIILAHPELIPKVPKDIVMCNWDYDARGGRIRRTAEFAAAGLPLVCCPGTNGWQSHGSRLGQAMDNVTRFAAVARRNGAEGLVNTDWGDFGHRNPLGVSYHGLAHGAAHAWYGRGVDDKAFTRRFCRLVFGDKTGRLAAAIRSLGAAKGAFQLYHALVEPFDPDRPILMGRRSIDHPSFKTAPVRRRLEAMRKLRIPRLAGLAEFESLALAEFELARRMDLLACRRIIVGRQLHAGKGAGERTFRSLAANMADMAADFEALWRARNRPSRLQDNLAAFRAVSSEARRLAR